MHIAHCFSETLFTQNRPKKQGDWGINNGSSLDLSKFMLRLIFPMQT